MHSCDKHTPKHGQSHASAIKKGHLLYSAFCQISKKLVIHIETPVTDNRAQTKGITHISRHTKANPDPEMAI